MKRNMTLLILASAVLLGVSLILTQFAQNDLPKLRQDTPIEMISFAPTPIPTVTEFKGIEFENKTTLINFWATWCAPCIVEFPDLLNFAEKHPNDVQVVFISNDHDHKAYNRFLAEHPRTTSLSNVILIHDPKSTISADTFDTYKRPETYVVNRNAQMVAKINGILSPDAYIYIEDKILKAHTGL